jgi:hypothetical protein
MGNSKSTQANAKSTVLPKIDQIISDPGASIENLMKARDLMYKQKANISSTQARALQALINATSKEQNIQSRYSTLNSLINSRQKQNRNKVKILNNKTSTA